MPKKTKLFFITLLTFIGNTANAQCHYIPSTSASIDTLSYSFWGGSFQSQGCAPIDPTFWLAGYGDSVTITFVNLESYPSIRVWGMNNDDTASVRVNGVNYPLDSTTASYDAKVVCGVSPGPDGILFANGKVTGPGVANYSYQNIQLHTTNVSTITVIGISGAGWGFAGVSVNCPLASGINQLSLINQRSFVYSNPINSSSIVQLNSTITNGVLNIYNLFGKKLKTINNIWGDKIKIGNDNLPVGVYFYSITENNIVYSQGKLIVQ